MGRYDFLKAYVHDRAGSGPHGFALHSGRDKRGIAVLSRKYRVAVPEELKVFYHFSYGAQLDEYEILTVQGIASLMDRLRTVYGHAYKEEILPFARLTGVGDLVSFDTRVSREGGLRILDCYHEVQPDAWKEICYGLEDWLRRMAENEFHPFWL